MYWCYRIIKKKNWNSPLFVMKIWFLSYYYSFLGSFLCETVFAVLHLLDGDKHKWVGRLLKNEPFSSTNTGPPITAWSPGDCLAFCNVLTVISNRCQSTVPVSPPCSFVAADTKAHVMVPILWWRYANKVWIGWGVHWTEYSNLQTTITKFNNHNINKKIKTYGNNRDHRKVIST